QRLDLVALVGDEIVPADAAEAADTAGPVGVQLVAEMLLEEFAAIDAMAFGQAQQPPFQPDQALVDAVRLVDKLFDAVVVELERLDQVHGLVAQLLEAALLAAGKVFAGKRRL